MYLYYDNPTERLQHGLHGSVLNPTSAPKPGGIPGPPRTEPTGQLQIQTLHTWLPTDFPSQRAKPSTLPSSLVPQADVLRLEHFLICCLIAKDEIQPVDGLHHSPAREYGQRSSREQLSGVIPQDPGELHGTKLTPVLASCIMPPHHRFPFCALP